MTVAELYNRLGADYEGVIARFGTEKRIQRFIPLFVKDPSYEELKAAVAASDWESAFRAAHTIKGTSANMGFSVLNASSAVLADHFRGAKPLTDPALYEKVCVDYENTINEIKNFMAEQA